MTVRFWKQRMSNQPNPSTTGRPSWDEYFLAMAQQASSRSPDLTTTRYKADH